jgi:segregation and condensation protein A
MDTLNMEIASSFVVMASTLLSVKVKMLLPKKELVFAEITDEEDPRAELVRQLLAYRQFKLLSEQFNSLEKGQALYRFGNTLLPYKEDKAIDPGLGPITITDLVQIFSKALDAYTANAPTITISREDIPVREKIEYILMMIINHKRGITFSKLIRNPQSKHEHVVTLLAILELARSKYISITQSHSFKEITIFCKEAGGQFDG